jgi:hypothetical protein
VNEETIKAILEELRALSRSAKFCELRPTVYGKPIDIYFAELADRVEAAVSRMRMTRVALERIVKLLNGLDENCGVDPVEIRDIARAALGDDCKEVTPCSP